MGGLLSNVQNTLHEKSLRRSKDLGLPICKSERHKEQFVCLHAVRTAVLNYTTLWSLLDVRSHALTTSFIGKL